MKKLLPLLLGLLGLAAGVGGGILLRPPPESEMQMAECAPPEPPADLTVDEHGNPLPGAYEYVKLNNQFIVPLIEGADVVAMVILSLSLEVKTGSTDAVYAKEPKLRDELLKVLFDHANAGGFRGAFTDTVTMDNLRTALREAGVKVLGDTLSDVLIVDIVRQDS